MLINVKDYQFIQKQVSVLHRRQAEALTEHRRLSSLEISFFFQQSLDISTATSLRCLNDVRAVQWHDI
jgi:hypothetical protein